MKLFTTAPERGDFAFQQLVAPCRVTGESLNGTRGFFGLLLSKSMPFGSVRDEDGNIYSFVRSVMAPTGTPNPTKFFYLTTLVDGQNLRMDHARMAERGLTPLPNQSFDGERVTWQNQPDNAGAPWKITASGNEMTWVEEGLFDLKGPLLGSGMQWYLPGIDWGTFYVSQMYNLSGTLDGKKVKGLIALDQVYMAEGGAIHFQKDLIVNNKKHVVWWTFATVYKDGTYDVGSILVGHDHLGYAILSDQTGVVRCSNDIEAEVVHKDGSYFAKTIRVVIDGSEEWEFLPDPKGEMIDFVGGFPITAQQEGRWRRVGDDREPDRWGAWGESDRRNGTARNVFGADL